MQPQPAPRRAVLKEKSGAHETILVATTPTERGQCALETACGLASTLGRGVVGFQVLDEEHFKTEGDASLKALEETLAERGGRDLAACSAEVVAFPHHYTDHEQGRAIAVLDAVGKGGIDLVVLGTHRRGHQRTSLSKTMTQKLLQHTPCPVLVAANTSFKPYEKVLVAVDFSPISFTLLHHAIAMAPSAEIHTVYVHDPKAKDPPRDNENGRLTLQNITDVAQADAKELGQDTSAQRFHHHVFEGAPAKGLEAAIDEIGPDLIVLGTKGRTGLARIVLGSVAAKIIDEPPCDVLVLRAEKD